MEPFFNFHQISWFTSCLISVSLFQTMKPSLHLVSIGWAFLQYLFHMKVLHREFTLVLNFNHNLARKSLDESNNDLKPNQPSSKGKYRSSHLTQCLPLVPSSLPPQKEAIILWIWWRIILGGEIMKRRYIGINVRTLLIRTCLPPQERNWLCQHFDHSRNLAYQSFKIWGISSSRKDKTSQI